MHFLCARVWTPFRLVIMPCRASLTKPTNVFYLWYNFWDVAYSFKSTYFEGKINKLTKPHSVMWRKMLWDSNHGGHGSTRCCSFTCLHISTKNVHCKWSECGRKRAFLLVLMAHLNPTIQIVPNIKQNGCLGYGIRWTKTMVYDFSKLKHTRGKSNQTYYWIRIESIVLIAADWCL